MTATFSCIGRGRAAGDWAFGERDPLLDRRANHSRHGRLRCFAVLGGVWLALLACAAPARAQVGQSIPSTLYLAGFQPFYEGDYKEALETFSAEARSSIKTSQSRWIDAICYETMAGECHYQMGELEPALKRYTAALDLFKAYNDWMLRVRFPALRPSADVKPAPWGRSARNARVGIFNNALILLGRIDNTQQYQQGGVVQQATQRSINAAEIVRCTALALRRRAEILGPTAAYDDLTKGCEAVLLRRPGLPNHWSEAWIQLQLGLALLASGRDVQGVAALKLSLQAGGEYDHPLTGVALLELGRVSLRQGDYAAAANFFEEASYAAFHFDDVGVIEEALRYGSLTHILANRPGMYPPLPAAAQWAKANRFYQLQATMLVCEAENALKLGNAIDAARFVQEARLVLGRRTMANGRIGGRAAYMAATVLFHQRKTSEGETELANAMTFMRRGSFWLFHIGLCDAIAVNTLRSRESINTRLPAELFALVLRDPQSDDWHSDPMEAMAVLVTPHPAAYEHWFEIAMQRDQHELALEVADRARRHRYFSTLPFGGRLDALRWLLEGPVEWLDQQARLNRRDLLVAYPDYAKPAAAAQAIRAKLAAAPLAPTDPAAQRGQQAALAQLADLSAQQEAVLREIALRREAAPLVFPPLRSTAEVQKSLPKGTAMLVFFATSRQLYGFLLSTDRYTTWTIPTPAAVVRQMQAMFRDLGLYQANQQLSTKVLGDTAWQTSTASVFETLMKGSRADFSRNVEELVVVPDGALWYLPFELMPLDNRQPPQPLISSVRVRYAPTMGLVTALPRPVNATGHTGVALGRLFPSEGEDVARAAFDRLAKALPGATAITAPFSAPAGVLAALMQRLIVFDDLTVGSLPYDWAPLSLDHTRGNNLSDWMLLPFGGPDAIILPGFHTPAEDAMKSAPRQAAGQEIFLTACGLMSTGTRTLLLSRWRSGGQSSFDLVREFAQELPHAAPAEAWQRAVRLISQGRVDLEAEPRVKGTANDTTIDTAHPFFWAGYLLIDSGTPADAADEAANAAEPAAPGAEAPGDDALPLIRPAEPPAEPPPPKDQGPREIRYNQETVSAPSAESPATELPTAGAPLEAARVAKTSLHAMRRPTAAPCVPARVPPQAAKA